MPLDAYNKPYNKLDAM